MCQETFYSVTRWGCIIYWFRSDCGSLSSRMECDPCAPTSRTLGHPVLPSGTVVHRVPHPFLSGCDSRSLRKKEFPTKSYSVRLLSYRCWRSDGQATTVKVKKNSRECKPKKPFQFSENSSFSTFIKFSHGCDLQIFLHINIYNTIYILFMYGSEYMYLCVYFAYCD